MLVRDLSRSVGILSGLFAVGMLARPAAAQQPSIEDLMRRIDALQHEVDQLKAERASRPATASTHRATPTTVAAAKPAPRPQQQMAASPPSPSPAPSAAAPAAPVSAAPAAAAAPAEGEGLDALVKHALTQQLTAPIPGLLPPEPMGNQFENEDALRSDLAGIALRIPGTDTQVRLYGFAKLSGYGDFNARNQTDTPPPQTIPLADSPAAEQGGDFGMTARFSRFGIDTRTLTEWGTLETRIEGDFGGGTSATTSTATFRLRQAWGELGTESFRVLIGQANSLWNEGVFETLIDATNLNQSFVRQAQVRATSRLAPGLTGMVSIEAPETQYTAVDGVFTPGNPYNGGASPAFNVMPDYLGRLTYRYNGLELDGRGLLRQLSIRTTGTAAAPPSVSRDALGWGLAGLVRFPMRWLADAFGPDQLVGMGYYGQGIGRYFPGNTSGQDALSNIGLQGVYTNVSLNPVPTYGFVVAYRRFWTPQLRSNVSYAYAREDYPSYASGFVPGTLPATSLNRDMQQVFVNLIWSPFARLRDGVVGTGWLDVGLEYLFTRRDVFGGSSATGPAGAGYGIANRLVGAAVARF